MMVGRSIALLLPFMALGWVIAMTGRVAYPTLGSAPGQSDIDRQVAGIRAAEKAELAQIERMRQRVDQELARLQSLAPRRVDQPVPQPASPAAITRTEPEQPARRSSPPAGGAMSDYLR